LITATALTGLLNTTNVTLAATNDITVSSAIAKSSATDTTLVLTAGNNINLNASISSAGSKLDLVLTPNSDNSGGGASALGGGATLNLNGGTLTQGGFGNFAASGTIRNATLVALNGTALTGGTLDGVTLGNALNPNFTTSGTITFNNGVTLGSGATVNMGTGAWRFTPGGGTQTIGTGGQRHHQRRGRHDPGGVWRRADLADRPAASRSRDTAR
jgi:hypothetical protein